ncbi:serine hydroxymethyltransferase [Spiroplasma taiwanense]|uniref:Serine hydroxymethyltransferase n=1 Tax=Spiroplasma taiwanense CT-1 TaxID=1276220 RepID=S5MG68_9MOLU|nr:serine hydroxymethyltransferase [Spiroplasma taiwanense]AGR40850.1 serine hydroxymethyltransferase [Spiroplasma taiwanense CT-1]
MIKNIDNKILNSLKKELNRQQTHIELIASENYVSKAVLELNGSILTNKYAEGYPSKRYYGGCEFIDEIESYGIELAKKLFNAEHANIQPHSGSQANEAAYKALLEPGDKVLSMSLDAGGHLTHGYHINFSGQLYNFIFYKVNPKTEEIDFEEIERLAFEHKPKLILAGASSYTKIINFKKFREIADKIGAFFMVDMAHIAGLVAGGVHPNPVLYADIVTTTTHKTLRGSRGGMILSKKEYAKKIDAVVFPGVQGGPLENQIGGKVQALSEALTQDFKDYAKQVILNAKALANSLKNKGFRLIANGTENHTVIVEVKDSIGLTGKQAETILETVGIIVNKNMIPFDKEKPVNASGIRLGSPAMTTRGFKEDEFIKVADIIQSALNNHAEDNLSKLRNEVIELCKKFPIYDYIKY